MAITIVVSLLINNGLKIRAKIIANRISKYGIDKGFIKTGTIWIS